MADRDQDGIDDELEEDLLRRFRPYYKLSREIAPPLGTDSPQVTLPGVEGRPKDEHYWPTDAIAQVRRAQLATGDWELGKGRPSIVESCGTPPSFHLDPPGQLLTCLGGRADLTRTPRKSHDLFLNIEDRSRRGDGPQAAESVAPGLYGHVVPVQEGAERLYKIEYWQFFAYNGVDVSGADHEADWCTVQLWLDPRALSPVRTAHYAHGAEMRFDLRNAPREYGVRTPQEELVELRGVHYRTGKGSLYDDRASFSDRAVRFFVDGDGDRHVVVYVERDSHEFWPTDEGTWPVVNEHNGLGLSYLTPYHREHPLNLGEVEHPLSADAEIILHYNGYWGCWHHPGNFPPPGPALHREWAWVVGSPLRRQIPNGDFES